MPHTNAQVASTVFAIVGTILVALLGYATLAISGSFTMFVDAQSAFICLAFPALIMIWAKPKSPEFSYWRLFTFRRVSKAVSRDNVLILKSMMNAAMYGALFGTTTGLVVIMANLSDPDKIGPGLAVALITMFYGVILLGIFEGYQIYYQMDAIGEKSSEEAKTPPQDMPIAG